MTFQAHQATFFYGSRPQKLDGFFTEGEGAKFASVESADALDVPALCRLIAWRSGNTLTPAGVAERGTLKELEPVVDPDTGRQLTPRFLVFHGNGFSVSWIPAPEAA